ncbi:MAG: hypothetical protein J6I69_02300 [Bacilli bacterium]|nr:hypothetical protein [Bacilli bacterium]
MKIRLLDKNRKELCTFDATKKQWEKRKEEILTKLLSYEQYNACVYVQEDNSQITEIDENIVIQATMNYLLSEAQRYFE